MGSFFKMIRSNLVAGAAVSILFGLVLVLMPGITTVTFVYVLAACIALSGIGSIVAYARSNSMSYRSPAVLSNGIVLVVCALLVFLFPRAVASVFTLLLGILILVLGIVDIVRALDLRSQSAGGSWVIALLLGIVVAVGGFVIVANPFETTKMLVMLLGAMLIVGGIGNLVLEWRVAKAEKAYWH